MKIEFDFPEGTWLELSGNFSADADASDGHMYHTYITLSKMIDDALRTSGYLPVSEEPGQDYLDEEPPIEEYDPGNEVDDQGGMSEYRHGIESEEPENRYVPDSEWTPGWPPQSSEDM